MGENLKGASISQLSELLGVARNTMRSRIEKAELEPVEGSHANKKLYYLKDVIPFFLTDLYEDTEDSRELAERKTLAETILLEMKVAKEKGLLCLVSEVSQEVEKLVMNVRNGFLNFPKKNAGSLALMSNAREIEAFLQEEIELILKQLAEADI